MNEFGILVIVSIFIIIFFMLTAGIGKSKGHKCSCGTHKDKCCGNHGTDMNGSDCDIDCDID